MNQTSLKKTYCFENPFKPDPLSKKALRYVRGKGTLLDVGCGEGADSVFFAKQGFTVTAFDKNKEYLKRFRIYCKDHRHTNITIHQRSAVTYRYPHDAYDVIISLLVVCCMKRSEFEKLVAPVRKAVKRGGIIVMSARNYLDPEFAEYGERQKMIETNTFRSKEDCCKFLYFIEENRLREAFNDFEVLYHYEGYASCKYNEHPKHGDSYIICRRKR